MRTRLSNQKAKTIDEFIAETTPRHQPFSEFLTAREAAMKLASIEKQVTLNRAEIRALFNAVPELANFAEISCV